MVRIIKDSTPLATVTTPTWVKLQENGSFALSIEGEAQGVVVDGTVYHLTGKEPREGCEDVILAEISETAYQREQEEAANTRQLQNETAMAELSILMATLLGGGQ